MQLFVPGPKRIVPLGHALRRDSRDTPQNGDPRLPQHVLHHRFAQPRRVIVEMQMVRLLVVAKTLQSVRIGEIAQGAKVLSAERILQLVCNRHECHKARIIPAQRSVERHSVRDRVPPGSACATGEKSSGCREYLERNEKARLEADLEDRFTAFEK